MLKRLLPSLFGIGSLLVAGCGNQRAVTLPVKGVYQVSDNPVTLVLVTRRSTVPPTFWVLKFDRQNLSGATPWMAVVRMEVLGQKTLMDADGQAANVWNLANGPDVKADYNASMVIRDKTLEIKLLGSDQSRALIEGSYQIIIPENPNWVVMAPENYSR